MTTTIKHRVTRRKAGNRVTERAQRYSRKSTKRRRSGSRKVFDGEAEQAPATRSLDLPWTRVSKKGLGVKKLKVSELVKIVQMKSDLSAHKSVIKGITWSPAPRPSSPVVGCLSDFDITVEKRTPASIKKIAKTMEICLSRVCSDKEIGGVEFRVIQDGGGMRLETQPVIAVHYEKATKEKPPFDPIEAGQVLVLDKRKKPPVVYQTTRSAADAIERRILRARRTLAELETSLKAKPAFDPIEAGRQAVEAMKNAEGGSWTSAELETLFNLTPATLHKRRANHGIVYWKDAKNQFFFPKWQFNPAGAMLPGIREALKVFRSSDEWRVMGYFLTPRRQLGERTPLELLRAGEVNKVLEHAKIHAEENSW